MKHLLLLVLFFFPLLVSAQQEAIPEAPREFRGVWIATVANIDWPSKPGLSTDAQQAELIRLFDLAAEANLNAVILQVRPMCDAFYNSPFEPWSHYLTGTSGQAPNPAYDPLEFAVNAAHDRGLEIHAWINPFRAGLVNSNYAKNHVTNKMPQIVRDYGKYKWLDPTDQQAHDYSLSVIADIVSRYNIDAIHFDDYFYPYQEKGLEFDDNRNWNAYKQRGGTLSRSDWRRSRVNEFVMRAAKEIKRLKPTVQFGISPFGIWKPGNPAGIVGLNAYAELFADSRKWLQDGTVDYLAPQLYWAIDKKGQEFPKLLEWWNSQNTRNRHVWPGLNISKFVNGKKDNLTETEIINQLRITQKSSSTGSILYSAKVLRNGYDQFSQKLVSSVFPFPALPPAKPWIDSVPPKAPLVELTPLDAAGDRHLRWKQPDAEVPSRFVLYSKRSGKWYINIYGSTKNTLKLPKSLLPSLEVMALSSVDASGNESPKQLISLR
ncbi:MAG: glycoside hydrolase family 10 protein [Sumerlaeia bacterium]